jgi:hypothetical protein
VSDRCYWHREEDGTTILIPHCWSRVHDPDAECTCTEWSEATARETLVAMKDHLQRMTLANQKLAQALRAAGLPDPTLGAWSMSGKEYTARQRRRAMHRRINAADDE